MYRLRDTIRSQAADSAASTVRSILCGMNTLTNAISRASWRRRGFGRVLGRGAGARPGVDGRFVYAVTSTGVYCRPSCPSRRPRRDRVALLRRAGRGARGRFPRLQALQAGRSRAGGRSLDRQDPPRLRLPLERRGPSVAGDAGRAARRQPVSPAAQLQAAGRRHAARVRRSRAGCGKVKRRLRQAGDITGAMLDAGYGSSSRFYERAVPKLGMAPSVYRRGGAGMEIGYTIVDSSNASLGRLLVAATSRGVCAVAMGSSDAELTRALSREYPAATIARRRRRARAVDERHPRASGRAASRGSICRSTCRRRRFSGRSGRRWRRFRTARRGRTPRSRPSIGQPRAVRAVARACATNPVALAIPCHRVVPAAGGEGGYRWGVGRKKALLRREGREGRKGRKAEGRRQEGGRQDGRIGGMGGKAERR